ncbi:MAG: hypothetical protein ACRDIV_18980 [Ktedonobacteraceae bacterium]
MSIEKILVSLIPVVETFEKLGIDYYVGGSVASLTHGIYRTTADVDVIADIRIVDVEPFVLYLQDSFYMDADSIKEAIKRRSEFSLLHYKTMFKVDIFIQKNRPFDLAVRSRIEEGTLTDSQNDRPFFVESPEDVVLTKLEWYKMGGGVSDRQWKDIMGVLKLRGTALEWQYLRHWAAVLNISDLLERALDDAGLKE